MSLGLEVTINQSNKNTIIIHDKDYILFTELRLLSNVLANKIGGMCHLQKHAK